MFDVVKCNQFEEIIWALWGHLLPSHITIVYFVDKNYCEIPLVR